MSKSAIKEPMVKETYLLQLDLESLKFIYKSCVNHILNIDAEKFQDHPDSIVQLETCMTIFDLLKNIDPDWLVQTGLIDKNGFHVSWKEWIEAIRKY